MTPGTATPVASIFEVLARMRGARVFHPRGVLLEGVLDPVPACPLPWPALPCRVVARLSKAVGTPGGFPDVLGLAFRVGGARNTWDVTLASAGATPGGRLVPRPSAGWCAARYGSLAPYRVGERLVWLQAVADRSREAAGAALADVPALADRGALRFTLRAATIAGPWQDAAELRLHTSLPEAEHPSFDPMSLHPPGMRLFPEWLSRLRDHAYLGSRRGRRAGC